MLVYDSLVQRRHLRSNGAGPEITAQGGRFLAELGIDIRKLEAQRRPLCRPCLDWSVRRHHLAGAVGAALLERCLALGWAKRARASRVVSFSAAGEKALRQRFELPGSRG